MNMQWTKVGTRRHGGSCVRPMLALLMAACSLVLAAPTRAAEPLRAVPVSPGARADGELPKQLREVLADFQERLHATSLLRWSELRRDETGVRVVEGHWSPALQVFARTCAADKATCSSLMAAQVLHMTHALERASGGDTTVATAATLSAIAELCGLDPALPACPLNRRMAEAGIRWLELGRESLAIDFLQQHTWGSGQFLAWLASRGEKPSASMQAQWFDLPPWLMATVAELRGQFSDARFFWLQALHTDIAAGRPRPQLRLAVYSLARLSWRLGDAAAGARWEAALAEIAREGSVDRCLELGHGWRVATARSRAEGSPPPVAGDRLEQLLQADCGFSKPLIEHATDALLAGPPDAQLAAALDRGVRACGGDCAPERLQHLQVLRQLAAGASGEVADTAAGIRTQLARSAGAMDQELQLAWAAAATLVRQPATHAAGTGIYSDLQALLVRRASLDNADTQAAQRERLRYEGVHRAAALAALQTGAPLDIEQVESLRAQTLLRRLRLQSRAAELETVSDPAARQRYDETLQQVRSLRRQFDALPRDAAAGQATLHAILQAIRDQSEDIDGMARMGLLEALAARKLDGLAPDAPFRRFLRGSALAELDRTATFDADRLLKFLDPQEAYLSWLQVPGGYIATLLWNPPVGQGLHSIPPPTEGRRAGSLSPHWMLHKPVMLTAEEEQTVGLLRTLMMEGGGALRGVRRQVAEPAAQTLRAAGQPVWRTAQGNFVAGAAAPAGAQPAQSLAEVAARVYQLLLQPLEAQWGGARRLVLSPDGPLAQLPFEALVSGGRPLVDRVEVSYVQSLAVHAELKRRAASGAQGARPLLSVADPDYGGAAIAPGPGVAPVRWQPLPGTRIEAQSVRGLFGDATLLSGPAATRGRLLQLESQEALAGFGVLHFATHGYVDEHRSALVLAGPGPGAYLQDGDISAFRLRSRLVVLSACDTGLGRHQAGEGVIGLPYAFMLAGNVNTVMSLWPIDDEATARFIPAFLAKAKAGQHLVQALNETKREFAAGLHGARNADPRVWAAFVQYGVPLQLQP
jgi:CHAT domain-containing protein